MIFDKLKQYILSFRLRRRFPKGVKMRVIQTGHDRYTLRATNLHTQATQDWSIATGLLAIVTATHAMWAIAEDLQAAGVCVDIDPGPNGKQMYV